MTDQLTIAGDVENPTVNLTERQRYALDKLTELGPIPSDELGAWMHQRRGWYVPGAAQRTPGTPVGGYDPATAEIPF